MRFWLAGELAVVVLRTDDAACGDGKVWMAWRCILKVGIAPILNMRGERKRESKAGSLVLGWRSLMHEGAT